MPVSTKRSISRTLDSVPAEHGDPAGLSELTDLADETIATVQRWLAEAAKIRPDASAERLAGVLKDPSGLPFTVGFVDGVIRPEDPKVAARNLAELAPGRAGLPARGTCAAASGSAPPPARSHPQLVIPDRPPGAARHGRAT